jgi:hypothetical protein
LNGGEWGKGKGERRPLSFLAALASSRYALAFVVWKARGYVPARPLPSLFAVVVRRWWREVVTAITAGRVLGASHDEAPSDSALHTAAVAVVAALRSR